MSQFRPFIYKELAEVADPNDNAAAAYVAQVAAYEIAGVVLRQTHMQHERGRRPAIAGLAGLSALGACMRSDTFRVGGVNNPDFGFHRDRNPSGVNWRKHRLISLHNSIAGSSAEVQLITARPTVEDTLPLPSLRTPESRMHRDNLNDGKVDAELFEPVCYSAQLHPGDTLAFIDYRTYHNFRTLTHSKEGRVFSVAYYRYALTPEDTA